VGDFSRLICFYTNKIPTCKQQNSETWSIKYEGVKAKELRDLLSFIPAPNDSNITPQLRSEFSKLIYTSIQALGKLKDDATTSQMLTIMQLTDVFDPDVIRRLIGMIENSSTKQQMAQNNSNEIARFHALYAALDNFLRLQNLVNTFITHDEAESPTVVELRIFDLSGSGIPTDALSQCMNSIEEIVDTLGRIYGIKDGSNVVAIESGSDVSVWVEVGKLVIQFKTFMQEMWQGIVYQKLNRLDRNVDSVTKAVTAFSEIEKKVQEGHLDRDTANQFKMILLESAEKAFDCQMYPTSVGEPLPNAKKLLESHKETRLLSEGNKATETSSLPE
jgi:hypothetical protein